MNKEQVGNARHLFALTAPGFGDKSPPHGSKYFKAGFPQELICGHFGIGTFEVTHGIPLRAILGDFNAVVTVIRDLGRSRVGK
jgi:hypothetical protein